MSASTPHVQAAFRIPALETVSTSVVGPPSPFRTQLLKWIGNKQRFAHEIASYFPGRYNRYIEPFLGSGAVLGTLAPSHGIGADALQPLMDIWQTLATDPEKLIKWYAERWEYFHGQEESKKEVYERIRTSYNMNPSGADLLFLTRSCYGGVIRFRKRDGWISTPCGSHNPITPESFSQRVTTWHSRTQGCSFICADFEETMDVASAGDIVYCDPPYRTSQSIVYGAQTFSLGRLFEAIARCKARGVNVALSIDGTKRSGNLICNVPVPDGLFEREVSVNCGRSMLKRFQMRGETLESEEVTDRLLLTY